MGRLTSYDFFSKMTKQMLNGIRVDGTEELERRIYLYFEEVNKVPVPYHWTYKLDDIDIEKEDINKIVYEVVNRKAAKPEDRDKRAPEPIKRKRKSGESVHFSNFAINMILQYSPPINTSSFKSASLLNPAFS